MCHSHFNPLTLRDDVGRLWENFCLSERAKFRAYTRIYANEYFWRTHDQQGIDLVEEREGQLFGYECKWSAISGPVVSPRDWLSTYPNATFTAITPQNYQEWVLPPRPPAPGDSPG